MQGCAKPGLPNPLRVPPVPDAGSGVLLWSAAPCLAHAAPGLAWTGSAGVQSPERASGLSLHPGTSQHPAFPGRQGRARGSSLGAGLGAPPLLS